MSLALDPSAVRFAPADGLVPGVVQDVADGRVLMVATSTPRRWP